MRCNKQAAFCSIIFSRLSTFHPPHDRPQEKDRTQKHEKLSHCICPLSLFEELPGYYTFLVRNCFYSAPGS